MQELNVANSIFPSLNDQQGIMLCGYEWGDSKKDRENKSKTNQDPNSKISDCTFSNKLLRYGDKAKNWRYDNRIIKWFELWGHPLSREGLGTDFEKCIIQTNWCNTQNHRVKGNYYQKLTAQEQINNFLHHVGSLKPKLILFFGSQQISILQDAKVLPRFVDLVGQAESKPNSLRKEFHGRRFYIHFQKFHHCNVVCLPHPSSTRGLSDEYIAKFREEISPLIKEVKSTKGL